MTGFEYADANSVIREVLMNGSIGGRIHIDTVEPEPKLRVNYLLTDESMAEAREEIKDYFKCLEKIRQKTKDRKAKERNKAKLKISAK